jgi:hypothetical protein
MRGETGKHRMALRNKPLTEQVALITGGGGIAWASSLSMPYAILSGALPAARLGIYMGVFNFFIVIPEIIQALTFGPIIRNVFGENNRAVLSTSCSSAASSCSLPRCS